MMPDGLNVDTCLQLLKFIYTGRVVIDKVGIVHFKLFILCILTQVNAETCRRIKILG